MVVKRRTDCRPGVYGGLSLVLNVARKTPRRDKQKAIMTRLAD